MLSAYFLAFLEDALDIQLKARGLNPLFKGLCLRQHPRAGLSSFGAH
jgi:hypothetical protein